MRYLRQFCAATMLICAFAFSAYAGNIECDVLTPAPQAAGYMPSGITDALILLIASLV
jgi:hypothetical protein